MAVRLDSELVRRGLARSRGQASELIAAGRVRVGGVVARRPATPVTADTADTVDVVADPGDPGYASRAGHKLAGALDAWAAAGLTVADRSCLDVGAGTGGFTDVLLRRGARRVVAVDVGHDQLRADLRTDPRVDVRDGVNVRDLRSADVQPAPGLVVADLSFISLHLVLPVLAGVAAPGADLVLLVKPQFEVGRSRLGSGGVVRDQALHADAVRGVLDGAARAGLQATDVVRSVLPGLAGNVEYFCWLVAGPPGSGPTSRFDARRVDDVVRGGAW